MSARDSEESAKEHGDSSLSSSEHSGNEHGISGSSAARGGLALAAGKLYFLVSGLAQQILLSAVLGLGGYGAYSTAQSVASISYNPLVQAGIQGVSRSVAGAGAEAAQQIQRRLLLVHTGISLFAAVLFFALAGPLSEWLGAPHVVGGLRLLSSILFLYGIYAAMIGVLNGHRRFLGQAGLDVLAATLRTVGLVVGALLAAKTFGTASDNSGALVRGTVLGFVIAGVFILAVAAKMAGLGRPGGTLPPLSDYARFVLPILGGQILLNLLFQADALLLRKFAADAAALAGLDPAAADKYVGAYRAAQLFCFLPFQLLTSISFVLFPLLAAARARKDKTQITALVERGLRLALLIGGLIICTLVTVPSGLLTLVFKEEASRIGTDSMLVLSVGLGFFAVLGVITTAMNSLGAERQSLVLILTAVLFVSGLCFFVARTDELGPALLTRVATATSLAMIVTTGFAALALKKVSGATLPLLSLTRTGLAVGLSGWVLGPFFQGSHVKTLVGAASAAVAYLAFLTLSGELRRRDLEEVTRIFRRR